MNPSARFRLLSALALVLAAGTAMPCTAQSDSNARKTTTAPQLRPGLDFRSSKWLSDRKVADDNGKEIANVSDLILDRGSGRIQYIVIKTGTTLGLGGRAIALPFGSFRWEPTKEQFLLASTPEQLKQFPEFSADLWPSMSEPGKDGDVDLRRKMSEDAAAACDPYTGEKLTDLKRGHLEGKITSVERVHVGNYGEQVIVTIDSGGKASRAALGPSWYVNGSGLPPMRGENVTIDGYSSPRENDLLIATRIRADKRTLDLRDKDGAPRWALRTIDVDGRSYNASYWRFMLLSTLRGAKVLAQNNETGTVNDIILDRESGQVAFISIDPNQNFLGIADTKRLVPWSVSSVGLDGALHVDATKDMILASPETPSDLTTLCSGSVAGMVYNAYNVPVPAFEPARPATVAVAGDANAWSAKGRVLSAIERNSATTLSGKVVEITDVTLEGGVTPARAITLKPGGEQQTILLGPAWYMDKQTFPFAAGDQVTIEACRTTINGKSFWLAKSVDNKGKRTVILNEDNHPAWEKR